MLVARDPHRVVAVVCGAFYSLWFLQVMQEVTWLSCGSAPCGSALSSNQNLKPLTYWSPPPLGRSCFDSIGLLLY